MSKIYRFTCIVCPLGCYIEVEVDGRDVRVRGCRCPRGEKWAREEVLEPKRSVLSVVKVKNGSYPVVSVKSDGSVPKNKIGEIMALLSKIELSAPVHVGDIVISNVLGLGVNIVATRSVEEK